MKKTISAIIAIIALSANLNTHANQNTRSWPCEVLLCMASPIGPLALVECLPAMKKLVLHLLIPFNSFPGCSGSPNDITINRSIFGIVNSIELKEGNITISTFEFTDENIKSLSNPAIPNPYPTPIN